MMRAVTSLLGIDLPALLDSPVTPASRLGPVALPAAVARFVAELSVLVTETGVCDERLLYAGTIQTGPVQDLGGDGVDEWPLRIPGLFETGLPFRLSTGRSRPSGAARIDGRPSDWNLQIQAPEIVVRLPFARAQHHPESVAAPAYLTPDARSGQPAPVLRVDAGVLHITSEGDVRIRPDATIGNDRSGGLLLRLRLDPPDIYLLEDVIGLRAGTAVLDLSALVSPPTALRAGFGPAWKGLAVDELRLFFPTTTPFFVPKSVGIRSALLGDGFAGEGTIELAADAEPEPEPTFLLEIDGESERLEIGPDDLIDLPLGAPLSGVLSWRRPVIAVADISGPWGARSEHMRWVLPDGETIAGTRTPPALVGPGDTIEAYYEPPTGDAAFEAPRRRVFMFRSDGAPRGSTAHIALVVGDATRPDVTHINAPLGWFGGVTLCAVDEFGNPLGPTVESVWLIGDEPALPADRVRLELARHLPPAPLAAPDGEPVRARELRIGLSAHGFRRFVIVDVLMDPRLSGEAPIVVSAGRAVELPSGAPVALSGQATPYHLATALATGRLRALGEPVALDPARPPCEQLPPGRVYELLPRGPVTVAGAPPTIVRPTTLAFFFRPGEHEPAAIDGFDVVTGADAEPTWRRLERPPEEELRSRLAELTGGYVYAVGRSSTSADLPRGGLSTLNARLAAQRADTGRELVTAVLGTRAVPCDARAETTAVPARWVGPGRHRLVGRAAEGVPADASAAQHHETQRVDLFIVAATWNDPPGSPETFDVERRVLIPCPIPRAVAPVRYELHDTAIQRLRLTARWDREPFPTLMEILAVVRSSEVRLDAGTDAVVEPGMIRSQDEFWRFVLRLVQDARTGRARWTVGVDAAGREGGLLAAQDLPELLGSLLVFGPLVGRLADTGGGGWVALSALLAAGVLGELTGAVRDVGFVLNGVSADLDTADGPFADVDALYLKLDYTVSFHVDVPIPGLNLRTTPDRPVRLRFRGIGVALTDPIEDTHLLFGEGQGMDVAVEDPGEFESDPDAGGSSILGNLVEVVAARLGQGSLFMELDLRFALDIGVVEITQSTVRLVFGAGGLDVEVRGLGVRVDIPGALTGTGSLALHDTGVRAELDLTVVPADLRAAGSLELHEQDGFTAVAVGVEVEFPTGLPLAATGLGVYGFLGHFAANMARAVPADPDPIAAELAWVGRLLGASGSAPGASATPWTVARGAWAFGVGAVVGTLADGGRAFHAKGVLVVEIPGPTVVFAIDAGFLRTRRDVEGAGDVAAESAIRGLIAITDEAFMVGIDVALDVADLLTIRIPIRALFPRPSSASNDAYVRIGTDGISEGVTPPRAGGPVSVELAVGGFLELEAFAYLMIEEHGLERLAGRDELSFEGFSVGFGLGIQLFLGSRDVGIYLEASTLVLAGLGTAPLVVAGSMEVKGELSILVLSLGISARIDFLHRQPGGRLPTGAALTRPTTTFAGEFCGELSLLFFSLRACFDFAVGDGDPTAVPPPPPLITGISFMDRRGFETAKLVVGEDGRVSGDVMIWPDSVAVLHFRSEPQTELDAASPFAALAPLRPRTPVAVGALRYEFTLTALRIEQRVGSRWEALLGPLDAAWWFPAKRPPYAPPWLPRDQEDDGEDVRELGLLTWQPLPWARALVYDAHEPVREHVRDGLGELCRLVDGKLLDCAHLDGARPAHRRGQWSARGDAGRADVVVAAVAEGLRSADQLAGDLLAAHPALSYLPQHREAWQPRNVAGRVTAGALQLAQLVEQRGATVATATTFETLATHARPQYDGTLLLAIEEIRRAPAAITVNEVPFAREARIGGGRGSVAVRDTAGNWHTVPGRQVGRTPVHGKPYVVYAFEAGVDFDAWSIPPASADMHLIRVCGHDVRARDDAESVNRDRGRAQERWRDIAADAPRRFVLAAGARHRVRAEWTWTGRHTEGEGVVNGRATQDFEFRTTDDARFDVRTLAGYVTSHPRSEDPPTFLGDQLRVGFAVDHVEALLERYRRRLALDVVRTDADETPGTPDVRWEPDADGPWDVFLREAFTEQRCLPDDLPLSGRRASLDVALAAGGRYDLLVHAPRREGRAEPLERRLILRAPFRASRYSGPAELLAAAGFGATQFPDDAVVAADIPVPSPLDPNDVDLAAALAAYGIDARETPERPRTTVMWAPPVPRPRPSARDLWRVVAVLVEADEALLRPGVLELVSLTIPGTSAVAFAYARASSDGSRVLFAAPAPTPLSANQEFELRLKVRHTRPGGGTTIVTGVHPLQPTPESARWAV